MKIDMSPRAVTNRLKTVNQLRRTCLSLANTSTGRKIQKKLLNNKFVQRTYKTLEH